MYNLPRYHPQLVNKSLASLSLNAVNGKHYCKFILATQRRVQDVFWHDFHQPSALFFKNSSLLLLILALTLYGFYCIVFCLRMQVEIKRSLQRLVCGFFCQTDYFIRSPYLSHIQAYFSYLVY